MSVEAGAPNMWSMPVTYSTFVSTGIDSQGYADTGPDKIGAVNFYNDPAFNGNVQYLTSATPSLPDFVPGTRFFVIGDWPEPHVVCHDRLSDGTVYCEGAPGHPNLTLQRGTSSMHAFGGSETWAIGEPAVGFGDNSTFAVELQYEVATADFAIRSMRVDPWTITAGAWVGEPPSPRALYGFWNPIKLTYLVVVYPSTTTVPPLRQHPRTDGRGMSSARRVWPPSRSVQGSLRQGPGAYL